jgi:hypothetical protein
MLWQAICAVVALGLLSWFVHVNPNPVSVYGMPGQYIDVPVWIVGCIGAVLGILLEFALTRRVWQAQSAALEAAKAQLRRARAKVKSQERTIAERVEKVEALEAQVEPQLEPLDVPHENHVDSEAPADDEEEQEGEEEDEDEVGI